MTPPPLESGGRIAIVSPSGCIEPSIIDRAVEMLAGAGYEVRVGRHARSRHGRFAGTRDERLEDLQAAFDDDATRVVMCSRGGYGAVQLMADVDMTGFGHSPKWVVGFSDITAIHALLQRHGYASLHAPMLKHIAENGMEARETRHLFDIMRGKRMSITAATHRLNRPGRAAGIIRGGNLAVLGGLRGTPYDFTARDTILFIEDVGEPPYRIDRMLWNLKLGGVFDNIAGLVVGQFTGYEDDLSMGCTTYELIAEMVSDKDYPVCFNFPVGHVAHNEPIVCGIRAELCIDNERTTLMQT